MHRLVIAAALAVALFNAATALAIQRTFVASNGADTNPCNLIAPCRGFAAALLLTDPNGEIIVLDSAGYGPVTVTKGVSIVAPPGVYAGISVFSGLDGVTVNAGASDKVVLRGLSINGQGGNRGIVVAAAGEVHIEQCTIANMAQHGIQIDGGTRTHVRAGVVRSNMQHGLFVAGGTPQVYLVDSQFSRNGIDGVRVEVGSIDASRTAAEDNGNYGFVAQPVAAVTTKVTLTDSVFTGNVSAGVFAFPNLAGATAAMAISRSTSARNGSSGFAANTFNLGTAFLTVSDSSSLENNANGVFINGTNATAIVTGSTLARNGIQDLAQQNSAVLRSSQNNALTGRGGPDILGTITPNPLQ